MTALARSAPLGHPWPLRGLLRRVPAARVRAGASGRKRGRARNGPGSGARSAVLEWAGVPALPSGARRAAAHPRGGEVLWAHPTPRADPPQLAGFPRGGAVVGSRPPTTPPGEGGAGPRAPAASLRLPAPRCPEAGSASWVSAPVGKIAPRTRSLGAGHCAASGHRFFSGRGMLGGKRVPYSGGRRFRE